jgi:hypothetical protein
MGSRVLPVLWKGATSFAVSPGGAQDVSPAREGWVSAPIKSSPGGATDSASHQYRPQENPSTSPVQCNRSIHRMFHRQSAAPRLNQILLQRKIPFRRTVRVINQHQLRIMLQSFRLPNHRFLILPQKYLRKDAKHRNRKRQIPRRDKIDPAQIPANRRHRRAARKPQLPTSVDLRPDIREHEINGRRHSFTSHFRQQLVRRAVRAWLVRAHPKSIWNRLKLFRLLMNAGLAPPEPRLMHKRPVRRVHQSDYPVIDVRRQFALQSGYLELRAKFFQLRSTRQILRQPRPRRAHEHPNVPVPLFAGKMRRIDPLHLQFVMARQRWNLHTPPAACVKLPPVITALHVPPVKMPVRKRNPPVRTGVAHRKRLSLARPPQNQRHFQQNCFCQILSVNLLTPHRRIPEVPQKSGIRLRRVLRQPFHRIL